MMEKEGNYSGNFPGLDYNNPTDVQTHHDHNQHQDKMTTADYMPNNNPTDDDQLLSSNFYGSSSFDKLSFADVMQFAEFGPKLALNQTKTGTPNEDEAGIYDNNNIDPVYFLKFPVLNDRPHDHGNNHDLSLMASEQALGGNNDPESGPNAVEANNNKGKRKRARSIKTSEEVESQRMTHIAVERNRRKQMNEHLRVLRSLMPSSYVQRGDQASIIGGAIEFVRELEQLLQCLESQKRRRLYGDTGQRTVNDPSSVQQPHPVNQPPLMFSPPQIMGNDYEGKNNNNISDHVVEYEMETAESKSCLADVEVKVLGFDALIKILSRRRPGQLIKTIAALEDLQLTILHTNITTIEQTVLYSFNVKIGGEARFTAEDMANSVQQILSFIHSSSSM